MSLCTGTERPASPRGPGSLQGQRERPVPVVLLGELCICMLLALLYREDHLLCAPEGRRLYKGTSKCRGGPALRRSG